MLKPARANSWIVASCSEPLGMPSLSIRATLVRLPEKARPLPRVADIAVAEPGDLEEHRVLVAVDEQRGHLQPVPRRLPLGPQRVARAAEEGREPGRARALQRLVVHEPDHQHLAARLVLDDRRYQPREFRKIHMPSTYSAHSACSAAQKKKPRRLTGGASRKR